MVYKKHYITQFRDSGEDGLVSLKGYMNLFQDAATSYMHMLGKGNDTILEDYGCAWVYTKYRLEVEKYCRIADELDVSSWISLQNRLGTNLDFRIEKSGECLARGKLESYLINMNEQKLCLLSSIEYPENTVVEIDNPVAPFSRLVKKAKDMELVYSTRVMYTDLDKSNHMNNIKYVKLFLNCFDPEFYRQNMVKVFEINYLSQSFFGEELSVYKKHDGNVINLVAVNAGGEAKAAAKIELF